MDWKETLVRVRRALQRRGRSEHDAEDLVQEAWIRLAGYEANRQIEVVQPEAFMMHVAMNLGIDAYRSKASRGEELLIEEVVIVDTSPSVEAVVLAKERVARLTQGLSRLPPKNRSIFLASRLEGLSYTEIAEEHGITPATVAEHVARATLKLTMWMEGW